MGASLREALAIVRATIRKKRSERKSVVSIRASVAQPRRFSSDAITLCYCRKHELRFQGTIAIRSDRTSQPGASCIAGTHQALESESKRIVDGCRKGHRKWQPENPPSK